MSANVSLHLTETDLRSFLQPARAKQVRAAGRISVPAAVITILAVLISAVNYASFSSDTSEVNSGITPIAIAQAQAPQTHLLTEITSNSAPVSTPTPTATPEQPSIPNSTLAYDQFSISAPITWDIPLGSSQTYEALKNGVVHLEGTAKPGQKGAVVLFGHSSDLPWRDGSYKSVFAPILKAKAGQEITLAENNVLYRYRVTRTYEVSPSQIEILQSSSDGMVRLVTCTPIGTNLRRFVVEATQISPDPTSNTSFTASPLGETLPGDL